jgi:flagellar biosynthetic protein FliR
MPNSELLEMGVWLEPWLGHVAGFALILARVSGMLSVGPLIGRTVLPWQARFGMAVVLSMLLAPLVVTSPAGRLNPSAFPLSVATEFLVGLLIGGGSMLVLWAVPLAGRLLDAQSSLPDDDDEEDWLSGSPITRWLTLAAVACFLTSSPLQGHVRGVMILAESFQACPLGAGSEFVSAQTATQLLHVAVQFALLLAAPALSLLVLMNLVLGLLSASGLSQSALQIGNGVRPAIAIIVLMLCLSGFQQALCDHLGREAAPLFSFTYHSREQGLRPSEIP